MHQRVGVAKTALSSILARGELKDLVTLFTGLNTYRPRPAVSYGEEEAVEVP
jgi:hypothetical protein